jgi:hypothetical protein
VTDGFVYKGIKNIRYDPERNDMQSPRLIANIIIVIILLSLIVATAEEDQSSDRDDDDGSGITIIWPAAETYHEEWNNEFIPASGGGTGTTGTYNDHEFQVDEFATGGVIVVNNFQRFGIEDIDIELYGANGSLIGESKSSDPEEKIIIEGTPDPIRNDDFDRGGTGTWVLRVHNWISPTVGVVYDASVDIYYDGAEYHSG